jgi:hypothetical protein
LARSTAILDGLTATANLYTLVQDLLPAGFTLQLEKIRMLGLIYQKLTTLHTATPQDLKNELEELNVIDRAGQLVIAPVTLALVIVLEAGATVLAVF